MISVAGVHGREVRARRSSPNCFNWNSSNTSGWQVHIPHDKMAPILRGQAACNVHFLLQLPAGLRQITPLQASSIQSCTTYRLFHSSGVLAIKKPSGTIIKPSDSKPQPRPTTPKKQPQAKVPAKAPVKAASPTPTAAKVQPAPAPVQHIPVRHAAPTANYKSVRGTDPLDELAAKIKEPVEIYKAPSHTMFTIVSYTSSAYLMWVSQITLQNFLSYTGPSMWPKIMGFGTSGLWIGFAVYLAMAPAKIITSVSLLPPKDTNKPQLSMQPIKLLPFWKPSPFVIEAGEAKADRWLGYEIKGYKHPTNAPKTGLLRPIRRVFSDVARMFSRGGFARIRVAKRGNWKLDVKDGCWTPDGGKSELLRTKTARLVHCV